MAKIENIQEVAIKDLIPYERNAKLHPNDQIELIAESIKEFGFISPCLIDMRGNVIAGHGRIEAAKKLGMETVPCVEISNLTEEQRRAFILADNKLTELGGWDNELVSQELEELKNAGFEINLTGFDIDDIIITDDMGAEISEEEVEEIVQREPRIKQGEVWILGRHRLMCGDSTSLQDVETLMGGASADLLLTDPPYNVAVENSEGMTIENDDMADEDFFQFLMAVFSSAYAAIKPGAPYYVWYASKTGAEFMTALKENGLEPRQQLIWIKNQFTLSRQDYNWRHEPCLYGWKEGASHYFIDIHSFNTVLEEKLGDLTKEEAIELIKNLSSITTGVYEDRPMKDDLHPTMKPVPLFKKLVRNSSREGDLVLDLFGGSGTTLVACEEMNRRCCMMEYDPHYAEVIIQRWEDLTGEKAYLLK